MNEEPIMEVRDEFMVSPCGDSEPTFRKAHFLKPVANSFDTQVSDVDEPKEWPLSFGFIFEAWRYPSRKWVGWVDTLQPKFESLWKKVGIFEAIMSTKYNIVKNQNLAFGVAEKWCLKTNTFLFPWGEATITLEDVMVLGGYPVVGDPLFTPLEDKEMKVTEEQLLIARREPWRIKRAKPSASAWMDIFKNSGNEIEHEVFLATWLSMFVFPYKNGLINKAVFPIAIRLAKGNRIALAPAVLASIYKDLSCLKETIFDDLAKNPLVGDDDELEVTLKSPFYLVQIWVWERFKNLQPEPNLIRIGDPVLARWHKVKALTVDNVKLALNLAVDFFVWRPYARYAGTWRGLYPENETCVVDFDTDLDEGLLSFVRCLKVCELVGLDYTIKQYLPHRVAMQFGMDQDVPGYVPRFDQTRAIAWENYCRPICDGNLYIPSRLFEADVTTGYARWWKTSVFDHPVKNIVRRKRSARRSSNRGTQASKVNRSGDNADVPPGFSPIRAITVISGKSCDNCSKTREGDSDVDKPSGFLPRHLKTYPSGSSVPTAFSPKYNTQIHCNSVANCNSVLEEKCEHLHNPSSSASTAADHGAVKDNTEASIRNAGEDFEDANGGKESRLSSDGISVFGAEDLGHSGSSETDVDELEQRFNKLEEELEQRINNLKRVVKLAKARLGHR
ncbi:hypothetical protein RIF29_07056 [Crotalaria pallida]|uniref:Aminotransferase-like plant mobile domain-containing protein n=1 Tax=Crotalaria pallida TaxID=3830 RepID=A0AAN9J3Z6_CROPI